MSGDGHANSVMNDEEVSFLPTNKVGVGKNASNEMSFGPLLTREDLMRLDSDEPIWRRVRLFLMIAFWVLWLGLLVAAIIVIVLTPKCPPKPALTFWESKVGYWLDPFSFADSNGDRVGDLKGVLSKLEYIKDVVGAGFIILGSIVSGHYTNQFNYSLGAVENFSALDPALGTMSDFRSLLKNCHRNGLEVVITLNFNSISINHEWVSREYFAQESLRIKAVARDGTSPVVQIGNKSYYSVGDKNTVDLDLTTTELANILDEIMKFWLNEGVDGILLSDAAFLIEDTYSIPVQLHKDVAEPSNEWFREYPSRQLFTNGSLAFVAHMRALVDDIAASSGRQRLLAVDPGDYGYGIRDSVEQTIKFLGSKEIPAANLVISRQFVKNRGWKESPLTKSWEQISVSSYKATSGNVKRFLALTTATPTDQRHSDIIALASIFLLPGTPIVYYGSELAIELNPNTLSPEDLYPNGKVPFPTLTPRDSVLICQLPMPWDRSGAGYSRALSNGTFANYLQLYGYSETVDSARAFGRGYTPFKMVQELIKLREKPSLKWGGFELLSVPGQDNSTDIEIFTRKATGFPAFIVALIRTANYGSAFNFVATCAHVIPRLTYPSRPELEIDVAVDSSRVYLKTDDAPAIYVFECA